MSAGEIIKSTVVPVLGGVVATIMFASPSKAVFKARDLGTIGSFNPLPLVMAMANCVAWTTYGFVLEDWFLVIPNSLGCLIATFLFLVSFGLGMPDRRARDQLTLAFMVLSVLLFVVTILDRMVITSVDTKKQLWGSTANLILVFYYLAPLSTLLQVLRQRDSSSLVLVLCMMNTLNGLLWALYGIVALSDPFVWAPNAFGAALGVVQTVLKLTIPSKETQPGNGDLYDLPKQAAGSKLPKINGVTTSNGKSSSRSPKALPHLDTNLSTMDEQQMFMTISGTPVDRSPEYREHDNALWLSVPVTERAAADLPDRIGDEGANAAYGASHEPAGDAAESIL